MSRRCDRFIILVCLGWGLSTFAVVAAPPEIPEAASRSRLIVLRIGDDAKARPVVALKWPTSTNSAAALVGSFQGLLTRELVRQAVLIAARDELGLATRDEVVGDGPLGPVTPDPGPGPPPPGGLNCAWLYCLNR